MEGTEMHRSDAGIGMFNRIDKGLWWDDAWTLVEGCTPVSEACDNCWALAVENRFKKNPDGKVRIREDRLDKPLKRKKPTVYAIWNDLFHEDVPIGFLTHAFDTMTQCSQHIFLILTKRPERMQSMMYGVHGKGWRYFRDGDFLTNVWLGVTAENQEQYDTRARILYQIPAAKRFISYEPGLGSIDLTTKCLYPDVKCKDRQDDLGGLWCGQIIDNCPGANMGLKPVIDWVICGGESGPNARPMHPDWARSLRDQCKAAGVPFLFKQWGEWHPADAWGECIYSDPKKVYSFGKSNRDPLIDPSAWTEGMMIRVGKKKDGRLLDGKEYLEVPR